MKRIKTIVEEYIAEGGAARLERRDGRDGVLFFLGLQVEDWVPLSSLGHNSGLGFYEINNCPHEENQSIPHETGWIKVSDALPDSGESVLAAYTDATGQFVKINALYFRRWEQRTSPDDDGVGEYSEDKDAYFVREGWYEAIHNWGDYSFVAVVEGEVSLWMPWPELPAGE